MSALAPTDGTIYQDAKTGRIYLEQNGIVVAAFTLTHWSKMLATPKRSTTQCDFSREPQHGA